MMRIETPALVLEPVAPDNAVVLWRIMQAGHLREFQDVPRFTRDEFSKRVAARPKRFDGLAIGRFEWLIVESATGDAAGWVSLRTGDQARGIAEIGYSVLLPYRGRGYASEASSALIDAAFKHTDLKQIEACCVPANAASRRLLKRIGFHEARRQRNGAIVRGRPVDIVIFEMSRERWTSLRGGYAGSENSIVIPASAKPK